MKCALSLAMAVVLLASQCVAAQDEIRVLWKFRVLLESGEHFIGTGGRLSREMLEGTMKNGESVVIPTSEIQALEVYTGSQAGKGALTGVGLGALLSLSVVLLVATIEDVELNAGNVVLGSVCGTALGGVIGVMAGSTVSKWERVPVETTFMIDPEVSKRMCVITVPF